VDVTCVGGGGEREKEDSRLQEERVVSPGPYYPLSQKKRRWRVEGVVFRGGENKSKRKKVNMDKEDNR